MARLRLMLATLLLVAFALGGMAPGATMHGPAHGSAHASMHAAALGGATTVAHGHGAGRGKGTCCPDGHVPACHDLCAMACCAAMAVLDSPAGWVTPVAGRAQFVALRPASLREVSRAPDPFPPRRSLIS